MRETEIFRRALGLLALGLLGGCASLPADRGVPEVQALTEARGVTAPAPPKDTQAPEASLLLNKPIDAARAVALTLRYNPQVQGGPTPPRSTTPAASATRSSQSRS